MVFTPEHVPSRRALGLAVVVIVLAAVPVAVIWVIAGGGPAHSLYRGMTFMIAAVTQLVLSRQIIAGVIVGAAAVAGTLVRRASCSAWRC